MTWRTKARIPPLAGGGELCSTRVEDGYRGTSEDAGISHRTDTLAFFSQYHFDYGGN